MRIDKVKVALLIPIICYVVFISTLYSNITISSTAFMIMVLSTIAITIFAFGRENDIKENQGA